MQHSFFDVPCERIAECHVYHDESGSDFAHSRYLLHGALFIPDNKWEDALNALIISRKGYEGRIHFVDLRDKTSSKKGEASWNWMNTYFGQLSYYCPYKCLVIDTESDLLNKSRYPKPFLLYNYSAMLTIRGALSWSFNEYQKIRLSIFSEKIDRDPEDNFSSYLPRELSRKISQNIPNRPKCPQIIQPIDDVSLITGEPDEALPEEVSHVEFIQLTDLLTSGIAQAIKASSTQSIKIDLGDFMAGWIEETRRPPWIQDQDLHRRFSVSCFPDSSGNFYNVPLAIRNKGQIPLI